MELLHILFPVGFALAGVVVVLIIVTNIVAFRKRGAKKVADKAAKAAREAAVKQLDEQLDAAFLGNFGLKVSTLKVADEQIKALRIPAESKVVAKRNELRILVGETRGDGKKSSKP